MEDKIREFIADTLAGYFKIGPKEVDFDLIVTLTNGIMEIMGVNYE